MEPIRNASDEGQVRDAGRRARLAREKHLTDFKTVLSTREGRRYIWSLLCKCGCFKSIWEQSAKIHYNAGQQDIGLEILAEMKSIDSELFAKMFLEAKAEEEESNA